MPGTVIVNQVPMDLYDADGNPVLIAEEGNMFMLVSRDPEQLEVLNKVHVELKKMNAYLSIIVGVDLESDDVDEEGL
jgi:hypothetical protein